MRRHMMSFYPTKLIIVFIQLMVNFDNIAKVLFARFIHCKGASQVAK